jgi:hypothetical protein
VETAQQLLLMATTRLEFGVEIGVQLVSVRLQETGETDLVQLGLAEGVSHGQGQSDQNEATHFCIRFQKIEVKIGYSKMEVFNSKEGTW